MKGKGMGEGMGAWSSKVLGSGAPTVEPVQPPDVKIAELSWLTDEQRETLQQLGNVLGAPGNPPKWADDPGTWERAVEAVEPYWDRYDEPYAVVTHVYKNMGGSIGG